MPRSRHPRAGARLRWPCLLGGCLAAALLPACSGGGGGQARPGARNLPPALEFLEPASAIEIVRGYTFSVRLVARDPDSVAQIDIFADGDGDLGTGADRFLLGELLEADGAVLVLEAPTSRLPGGGELPEGTYFILGVASDARSSRVAAATGTVAVDNVAWARSAGGNLMDGAFELAADRLDGSATAAGSFQESVLANCDPGQILLASAGGDDVLILRYGPDGTLAWARSAGGPGFDRAHAVQSTVDGGAVVAGRFEETATFGDFTLASAGNGDAFLAAYDADGTVAWAVRAGGADFDQALSVEALDDGGVLVTGEFRGDSTFGSPPNQVTLSSLGASDAFVARYNADGSLAWVRQAGGASYQAGVALTPYSDGSFVLAGAFLGDVQFVGTATTLLSAGGVDVFLARYDAGGSLAWARGAGGVLDDAAQGIARLSDGSLLAVGTFQGAAIFGLGEPRETTLASNGLDDLFMARFSADGALIWAQGVGGVEEDLARDVVALDGGGFAVAGLFRDTVTFGAGYTFTADGANDAFLARLTADGALDWAARAAGSPKDGAFGVAAYADGSLGLAGRFREEATFGRGDERQTRLRVCGDRDAFVARYNPDGKF